MKSLAILQVDTIINIFADHTIISLQMVPISRLGDGPVAAATLAMATRTFGPELAE